MAEHRLDVCVQDSDDYVLCDAFDMIPRTKNVRELDVYDMEIDRLCDGLLEVKGNEGKGRLWVDGNIDQDEARLTILLQGPA